MIMPPLEELFLYPIDDRGVPNKERISILVRQTLNLGQYGVMVGQTTGNKFALPFQDNLFWFGDGVVNAGDWIILYTGKGHATVDNWGDAGNKLYSIHWGRASTMFANTNIVPILFRIDSINIVDGPKDLPQLTFGSQG